MTNKIVLVSAEAYNLFNKQGLIQQTREHDDTFLGLGDPMSIKVVSLKFRKQDFEVVVTSLENEAEYNGKLAYLEQKR